MDFFQDIDRYEERIAVLTETSKPVTYKELLTHADAVKKHLTARALAFCFCDNNVESLAGYLGFLRGGAPAVMLSSSLHPTLASNLLDQYKPRYLWLPKKSPLTPPDFLPIHEFGTYVLLENPSPAEYAIHEDLALLLSTSGSTGSPKLVRQSYQNIISNAQSIADYLEIGPEDRPITTLPMYYTYGLSILNSHLLRGCTLILTSRTFMEKAFWELFRQTNATTFGGVPYSYEMLKKLRFSRMDLQSLKVLTQAGGKLSPELSKEFATICEEKGIRFITMYGQTEATARMSYVPPQFALTKVGTIGIAIPGGAFWLVDEQGETITEPGTVGELVYQGPNVAMGYARSSEDLDQGDENQGVLHTGDLASFDSDGYYSVVGRKRRFLKLYGNRVNLDEVEHLLRNAGYDCACTGADDNLQVFVTGVTDAEQKAALSTWIAEKTGIHRFGFSVLPVDALPRNEAGKILYHALLQ